MSGISDTRLYASSIAIVSGVYSIGSVVLTDGTAMLDIGGWIMLAIGVVVLLHGIALLTPAASRMRRTSGPLMVAWATIMLLNQWLPGTGSMMGMAADAGMIAIAVLMLASGLIMMRSATPDDGM